MADEPVEMPAVKPLRLWAYLIGVVVFQILNALYWAFVGGLGWGFGWAVGSYVPWPGAGLVGGAAGLALVLFSLLTIGPANYQRSQVTPIQLSVVGAGTAAGLSLALLTSLGRDLIVLLGGGAGFVLGVLTIVMKQTFAPIGFLSACLLAVTGSALFTGVGTLAGGPLGWAAAGSIALFTAAMLAEYFRREPAVEIDANEQPVRIISRGEMLRWTAWHSWHPRGPVAWGWHGWFAGLVGFLWASWVMEHPKLDVVRQTFLWCGGFAALMILIVRLGIVKAPEKTKDEGQVDTKGKTP